ncbi:MAG: MFS transporter [Syntrophales bacterium]|jgi:UMF1 family MFS transporter|nr:MFS transporter [Syntrophales bacterium]MDY0044792.1 MFS transporter [Syntrophales bacterium]
MQRDTRKTVFGWAMYDWANSAFATTIMAAFFPIFFKKFWSAGADPVVSTAKLGMANSIAGIMVAVAAPILGAIADRSGAKKKFLLFFAFMGVVMTASLYLVSKGSWVMAIVLYVMATIGFSGGNVFYDSLITAVSSEKRMDLVSALGFSMGYLGGGLLFAVNVWMTLKPATFGFADAGQAVRFAFLTVALWWALFSIPLFLFVHELPVKKPDGAVSAVAAGLRQLRLTFREIRHLKVIFTFLVAYWLYIDGVDTIIRMALDYGMSIGFDSNDLILALLITQFVGFPSAIAFGWLGGKIGTKRAIYITIAVYSAVTIYAAFITHKNEFFLLAIVIGLVQGGVQALSRSYYARIIPVDKSAEFFGFYNLIGKFSVVIGPLLLGLTALFVRWMGYSSDTASRISILSIAVLFIAGGVILYFVDEKAGKNEARYLSAADGIIK